MNDNVIDVVGNTAVIDDSDHIVISMNVQPLRSHYSATVEYFTTLSNNNDPTVLPVWVDLSVIMGVDVVARRSIPGDVVEDVVVDDDCLHRPLSTPRGG